MANRINQLLEHWSEARDSQSWVLATIIETDGSSYRKAGAMMLINDLGQYFGLLSGGCLESDIMRQARRCWDNGKNRIVKYDMREEEDLAWQLGIGCGGMVRILLQPVNADNGYLCLDELNKCFGRRQAILYKQQVDESFPVNSLIELSEATPTPIETPGLVHNGGLTIFTQSLHPEPCVAVFGAGIDAKPLVAIATELGWRVILLDPRAGYAREEHFPGADQIIKHPFHTLKDAMWLKKIDAAFVLTHNIKLDAEAISLLQKSVVRYMGLLGPGHRTQRVLEEANLNRDAMALVLANPAGLRLGGELPESIALSMLSEAHAVLEGVDGKSISNILS